MNACRIILSKMVILKSHIQEKGKFSYISLSSSLSFSPKRQEYRSFVLVEKKREREREVNFRINIHTNRRIFIQTAHLNRHNNILMFIVKLGVTTSHNKSKSPNKALQICTNDFCATMKNRPRVDARVTFKQPSIFLSPFNILYCVSRIVWLLSYPPAINFFLAFILFSFQLFFEFSVMYIRFGCITSLKTFFGCVYVTPQKENSTLQTSTDTIMREKTTSRRTGEDGRCRVTTWLGRTLPRSLQIISESHKLTVWADASCILLLLRRRRHRLLLLGELSLM